jgi:hypothetical protein
MEHEVILEAYRSYNARDIDAVLALMCDDVNWQNGMTGDRIKGREALRTLWLLQWSSINPTSEVLDVYEEADGRTVVRVRQMLHEPGGLLLLDQKIEQVYTLRDGLIARMDFRSAE